MSKKNVIKELIENQNKYIKEGWFSEIDYELFENNENRYQTSIIDCINNCKSPRISKNNKIKIDDLKVIFKAFSLFGSKDTRVLILGQDPYTDKEKDKATGLAFLLNREAKEKDSLYYILKTINDNKPIIGRSNIEKEKIEKWVSDNKVLLLNTSLTYEYGNKEERINVWEPFIKTVIYNLLINAEQGLSIFLWGKDAQNNFIKILNRLKEEKEDISFDGAECCKNNKNKFKLFKTVKRNKNHIIAQIHNKEIKVYMYSHPSKLNEIKKKPLPFDCSNHFQDKMWKDLLKIYSNI